MAGDRGVRIGRDAVGNVITTGDHNLVEAHVTATKREASVTDPDPRAPALSPTIGSYSSLPPSPRDRRDSKPMRMSPCSVA